MRPALVLVDGMNLLCRAHFGFPARIRSGPGIDITAAFGFFALLRKALRELGEPAECAVAFDTESSLASRMTSFPAYKAYRFEARPEPDPRDDLGNRFAWLPTIFAGLDAVGIAWAEASGHEADDLIASAVRRCRTRTAYVMSTDRDFHQLLGPRTHQLYTMRPVDRRVVTSADVLARYDVSPSQWCDFRSLTGDPADGIPGVAGVGLRRAAEALGHGGSLERSDWSLHGWWGRRVAERIEEVLGWRELIRLRPDVHGLELKGRPTPELPLAARVLEPFGVWNLDCPP